MWCEVIYIHFTWLCFSSFPAFWRCTPIAQSVHIRGIMTMSCENSRNFFRLLFLAPRTSNAGYLWYIYLLFFFYCLIPVLSLKNGIVFIGEVLVAILLLFFPIQTEILVLDHFSRFFVFFLAGTVCSSKINFWRTIPHSMYLAGGLCFVGWSFWFLKYGGEPYNALAGVLSIPACVVVAFFQRCLEEISINCFWIYLLHLWVIQAGAKVATFCHISGNAEFVGYAVLISGLAIAGPIVLRKIYNIFLRQKEKLSCGSPG